jgi:hypothetical protein
MKASLRVAGVCLVGGLLFSSVSSAQQSIRTECRAAQLGRACDPDGTDPNYGACDGLCTFDSDSFGTIVCIPISTLGIQTLEHQLCGTGAACSQTCNQAGECVSSAALDGTACSHANQNAACSGQCVAGACQAIAPAEQCALGPDPGGCGFRTCSPRNAGTCVNYPYPATKGCSTGTCDGCGACDAAPAASVCVNPGHCGNGRLDPGESCEGTNLSGETCASVTGGRSPSGTLHCSASCTFATNECTGAGGSGGTAGSGGVGGAAGNGGVGGTAGNSAGGMGGVVDAGAEDGSSGTGGSSGASAGGAGGLGAGGETGTGGSAPASGGTGGTPGGGTGGLSDGGPAGQAGSTANPPRFAEGGGCDCRTSGRSQPLRGQALIAACGVLIGAALRRRGQRER